MKPITAGDLVKFDFDSIHIVYGLVITVIEGIAKLEYRDPIIKGMEICYTDRPVGELVKIGNQVNNRTKSND